MLCQGEVAQLHAVIAEEVEEEADMNNLTGGVLAVIVLLLAIPAPSQAGKGRGSVGPQAPRGGHPDSSGSGSTSRPHPGASFHPGGGARPWWGPRIYWAPPVVWGGWYPADYYYAAPPAIIQEPPAYVQPSPAPPYYWYYCPNPAGYYPCIPQCPSQWITVVPTPGPPAQ